MPMRHASVYACRDIIGQLRQMAHECVGDAGIRIIRMPAFFLSADFNPDNDDNHNDCNPNAHWLSPPFPAFPGRGLRPMTQRHFAVSALNILPGDGFVKSQNKIILASNFHNNSYDFMRFLDKILNP